MNKFGNNTNRTMFTGTCAAAAILLLLTGCANTEGSFRLPGITIDNTTEAMTQMAEKETVSTVVSAEELTEEEKEIFQLEMRYAKGEFAPKDYHTLAKWYRDRGMVRRQRDLLEESYRLFDDKEAFEMLQDIWVNLAEEEEEILKEAVLMRQNLELADTYGEGIGLITSSDWFDTMMPKLTEGKRNYYLETEGKERLTVSLGFDGKGKKTAQVYHETTDGKVVALQREDTMVKLLTTGLKEDKYDGAFEAVTLWTGTGDMMLEEGTFTDGVYTGEYTCRKRAGNGEEEAALLYQNRENMDYTVYTGEFDEQGKTTLEQPDGKSLSLKGEEGSFVVYARDDKGEKCLFYRLDESQDKESFAFTAKLLGWVEKPVAETYEVVEATVLGSNPLMEDTENRNEDELPKVRIYDGRLQVMNRGIWVDMGKVESLAKEDPFLVYATKEPSAEAEASEATQEQDEENGKTGVREGSLTKPAAQKPETTKPAVTKPATPKPAPTPAPKPEPEPEPEEEAEEEEEEPTPTPAPTPEPTPAPTPTPEPTPTPPENTGDVDIEWTEDILS